MKFFNAIKKKAKWITVSTVLVSGVVVLSASSDQYFQISKNLDIFATLFKELNVYYVDDTEPGELMKVGIDAMLESLDPYTVYYPESQIEDFRFMTTGQYGGIGALIRKVDDYVIITEPYEGFPAYKAGLRAGDQILEVDGKTAEGKSSGEISKVLKGQPNSELKLKIQRPGVDEPFEVTLTRMEVKINDVPYYGVVGENTGYIKLTSFTETASKEVKEAFGELKDDHQIESLILDLRGNGGGLLREAVNIVNIFVKKGQEVVFTKGKVSQWDHSHRTINSPMDLEIPLVVLVNESSASASEIVAGTLQDIDRAVIIGQNSFGKGLVQQTKPLSYNSKLKLTVAKYYTPSGRCIQRIDYSHKDDDGIALEVPDSLITEYKTKNGRPVYDGAGIRPDIEVEIEKASPILASLLSNNYIFEYATAFRMQHDSISKPSSFQLNDDEYTSFQQWLSDKEYDYTTTTEQLLERLEKATKKERYYEHLTDEFSNFREEIKHNKEKDLVTFKDQVAEVLGNEIVSRYYYSKGRIQYNLQFDRELEKALETFNQMDEYKSILAGPVAKN
ncbi:MAG: peptidase S41 [Crocinitomicaceae bacterium]|nr:peptidase S41 [Crocinitomicaceae bacterium]|tara:strand:+ start:27834 stop:29516 length:1683 start_codon:yes stop_codon:yes gene_type:complete